MNKKRFFLNFGGLISFIGIPFIVYYAFIRPAMISNQRNLENVEAVKKGLRKGFLECRKRFDNKQSTNFTDIPSFFAEYKGFEIRQNPVIKIKEIERRGKVKIKKSYSTNSCFEAKAIPLSNKNTWFKYEAIERDVKNKCFLCTWERYLIEKNTCGDTSKAGCSEWGWIAN